MNNRGPDSSESFSGLVTELEKFLHGLNSFDQKYVFRYASSCLIQNQSLCLDNAGNYTGEKLLENANAPCPKHLPSTCSFPATDQPFSKTEVSQDHKGWMSTDFFQPVISQRDR